MENDGISVSLRLPSRISELEASTSCGGFHFMLSDSVLEDGWVNNMKLWDRDAEGKVFIKWNLSPRDLDRELGIRDENTRFRRPSPPQTSYTPIGGRMKVLH